MSGDQLASLFTDSLMSGLLEGVKIIAPYIIGFCILCIIVAVVKKILRKKK